MLNTCIIIMERNITLSLNLLLWLFSFSEMSAWELLLVVGGGGGGKGLLLMLDQRLFQGVLQFIEAPSPQSSLFS